MDEQIYHDCPFCGYRLEDILWKAAKHDYPCPRCNQKRLSQFRLRKVMEVINE